MVMQVSLIPSDFRIGQVSDGWTLQPMTARAYDWIERRIPKEAKWVGTALSVSPSYVEGIMQLINHDGLVVR